MKMIPHEEFRLARIFVRVMRVVTNVILLLSAVAGIGWACYVMVAAISDFWNHSDDREAMRQRVQAIPAERDERVAALAGEESREAQRLEQEIQSVNAAWGRSATQFNELLRATSEMVKKAVESAPVAVVLPGDAMTTLEACAAVQPVIDQASGVIGQLKNALYAGMDADINAMVSAVQTEKNRVINEIQKLKQENAQYAAEIQQIKSKYKDTREVVTIYQQKDALLADHCVYDLSSAPGEDVSKHARDLSSVGFMLPAMVNRLSSPNYLLPQEVSQPLYARVSRLSAWLPMLVAGGRVEERSEEEIPMDPLVLSEEDQKRVNELNEKYSTNDQKISNLGKQVGRCETELENLELTRKDIAATKQVVLSKWKVDPALESVRVAYTKVQDAVKALETLRETYIRKKESLIAQYEREMKDCHVKEEASWKSDCAEVQKTIQTLLWYAALPIAGGWLLWVILMTWIDFAAAILVGALRAQAAHERLEEKKEV